MAQKVKIELNTGTLNALTEPAIEQKTREITIRCGEGYEGDVIITGRPHGAVRPVTVHARRSNLKHNTLLKAVNG